MAGEPTVTLTGRIGNEPQINFTQTGRAVANISVAVTPSTKDGDKWIDKDTLWFRVALWRNAEAAVEELQKGDLVTVAGKLSQNTYTNKEGETKITLEIDADYVGLIPTTKKQSEEAPW